jgi:hypothetical protein
MSTVKERITDTYEDLTTRPIQEGPLTKKLENQTAKIPSMFFLNLALGAIAVSAVLKMSKKTESHSNFVGLWAPTLLLLGIYNKLVKIEGNDRFNRT